MFLWRNYKQSDYKKLSFKLRSNPTSQGWEEENMKDDLKRLMNEFLEQTWQYRQGERDLQLTEKMPPKKETYTRQATLVDFIDWLNDRIEE